MNNILKWLNKNITPYCLTWLGVLISLLGLFIMEYTTIVASFGISLLLLAMYVDKYGW